MIIGVTGGVGSGKSEVVKVLEKKYHAHIIAADKVAHQLMEPGRVSYRGIVEHFGNDILNDNRTINREKLGAIVFSDKEKLQLLNAITHENVDKEIVDEINDLKAKETDPLIICEAALLVGAEYEKQFDSLWFIYTKESVRRERLKASRGYTEEKIDQMIKNQKNEEEFKVKATHVIDNSSTLKSTKEQIAKTMESCYNGR